MSRKTHEKELARARARRQAERRAQQRRTRLLGAGAVLVVAVVAIVVGLNLSGGDEPVAIDDTTSPDPSGTEQPTDLPTDGATSASDEPTGEPSAVDPPAMVIDPSATYTATIETEEGPITVELAAAQAPTTVNNFVSLAAVGFYDGVVFHRIQEGFVIQGGDPLGTGAGGPGYRFEDELGLAEQVVADNGGQYPRGTLAMANAGPDTNGSQFFIVDAEPGYPFPPNYAVFGRVVDGLDTVDAIAAGEVTGPNQDQAVDPVAITGVTIDGPVDEAALADFSPRAS